MKRRDFLKTTVLTGTGIATSKINMANNPKKPFPKRMLGKTGEELSIIGFGGIVVKDTQQEKANDIVAKAFDKGINYYDVAPSYGNAQEILGPALKPYRRKSFLACKTTERSKEGARKDMEASLQQMKTNHFDLYQLHAITTKEDVEKAFGKDGAMETIHKAREDGKIRFIGFSAHSEEAALLAMEKFDFDTILFPFNFVCWHKGKFGPKVMEKAKQKGMGILALKAMAKSKVTDWENRPYKKLWYNPLEDEKMGALGVRFTLSKDVTAAIPPGDEKFFWKAVDIARNFKPITSSDEEKLIAFAAQQDPIFSTV